MTARSVCRTLLTAPRRLAASASIGGYGHELSSGTWIPTDWRGQLAPAPSLRPPLKPIIVKELTHGLHRTIIRHFPGRRQRRNRGDLYCGACGWRTAAQLSKQDKEIGSESVGAPGKNERQVTDLPVYVTVSGVSNPEIHGSGRRFIGRSKPAQLRSVMETGCCRDSAPGETVKLGIPTL